MLYTPLRPVESGEENTQGVINPVTNSVRKVLE